MKKYGVIMAGGGGTRFWPLSRQKTPKQLLNLTGNELMINEAIDRLAYTVDKEDIFVVTNATQVEAMSVATKGRILCNHIISEPSARNTAACIGYAAMEIMKKYGDGIMIITPSDAYIQDNACFTRTLAIAVKAAEEQEKLVTIGIEPTFPATGYGYIRFEKMEKAMIHPVVEFKEKPDEVTAKQYLDTGKYLWNSGMFVWKASVILRKFEKLIPDIYQDIVAIGNAMGMEHEYEVVDRVYPNIRKISVDYAIMEPAAAQGDVLVIPGSFGWNDVGSWDMMGVLHDADDDGNIALGNTKMIKSKNSVAYSSNRLVAMIGMENTIVVETADAVLVCDKNSAQDVKLVVDWLQENHREDLL